MISMTGRKFTEGTTRALVIISGLFMSLIFLEVVLRLGCCTMSFLQEFRNRQGIEHRGVYKIMCVGESSTAIGGENSYPNQLEAMLNRLGNGLCFRVINKGVSTVDSNYIIRHLEENVEKYKPDMVIAMMGINDRHIKYYEGIQDTESILFRHSVAYRFLRFLALDIRGRFKVRSVSKEKVSPVSGADIGGQPAAKEQSGETDPGKYGENDYIRFGRFYREKGQYHRAEEAFRKALSVNPANPSTYVELGWTYTQDKKYLEAKDSFVAALNVDPSDKGALLGYGLFCSSRTAYHSAEEIFKRLIEVDPYDEKGHVELAWVYMRTGKYSRSEEVLKKYVSFNPGSAKVYAALSTLYRETGRPDLADVFTGKMDTAQASSYSALTVYNYKKMKEILDKKGIKLACMGYPMRSVEPLKTVFSGNPGVLIIDNENVFKKALKRGRYRDYFLDMFGGNFGHCRRKGNALIAENAANNVIDFLGREAIWK